MTTIADFRPSISEMSEDELLEHIRTIRSLRRMMPERAVRKTKTAKTKTKTKTITSHIENLSEAEKLAMAHMLLRLKK